MNRLVLIAVLFTCFIQAHAQTVNLDVLMGDKKIGDITATKKKNGKTVTATLSSKVSVKMLFEVNVASTIASEYKDGKLIKTEAERVSNIKSENKKSTITWDGSRYTVNIEGSAATTLEGQVSFCVLDLYLTEPKGISQAFSELGARYMPVTPLENHRYQLQISDSKKDVFVYDDKGKLLQVETVIAMNKVTFKVR